MKLIYTDADIFLRNSNFKMAPNGTFKKSLLICTSHKENTFCNTFKPGLLVKVAKYYLLYDKRLFRIWFIISDLRVFKNDHWPQTIFSQQWLIIPDLKHFFSIYLQKRTSKKFSMWRIIMPDLKSFCDRNVCQHPSSNKISVSVIDNT